VGKVALTGERRFSSWIWRGVEPSWKFRTHDVEHRCGRHFGPLYDAGMMCGIHSKTDNVELTWVGEVIRFWFEELGAGQMNQFWYLGRPFKAG
jgi:hypothetical protein